jgi:hypothetical protein
MLVILVVVAEVDSSVQGVYELLDDALVGVVKVVSELAYTLTVTSVSSLRMCPQSYYPHSPHSA